MKHLAASLGLLVLVVGCSTDNEFKTVKVEEFNFDKVWAGAIDAVTNRMALIDEKTNKEERRIVAHTEGKWKRRTATILISEGVKGYDVKVKADVEKNMKIIRSDLVISERMEGKPAKVTKPSDLTRHGDRWRVVGDDCILRHSLASDIKKAVENLR